MRAEWFGWRKEKDVEEKANVVVLYLVLCHNTLVSFCTTKKNLVTKTKQFLHTCSTDVLDIFLKLSLIEMSLTF